MSDLELLADTMEEWSSTSGDHHMLAAAAIRQLIKLQAALQHSEEPVGEVTVTKNPSGQIVCVTRNDADGRILSVIAESTPQPVVPEAEALARMFHETYESLAEVAGYETRLETRSFNLESPNGRLMVLVCAEIRKALLAAGKETV
jgi:hypothetical protein